MYHLTPVKGRAALGNEEVIVSQLNTVNKFLFFNRLNAYAVRSAAGIEENDSINSKLRKPVITSSSTIQKTKSAFLAFLKVDKKKVRGRSNK